MDCSKGLVVNRCRCRKRIEILSAIVLVLSGLILPGQDAHARQRQLRRTDTMVEANGTSLFVREIIVEGQQRTAGPPVILIHGARVPGIASFDLPVAGGSLAADIAEAGYPTYVIDLGGYGRSSRPREMSRPPQESEPLVNSHEVVRDLSVIVKHVREKNQGLPVALIGWATGGHWAGMYASLNPSDVSHLVIHNSLYGGTDGHPLLGRGTDLEDPERPGNFNTRLYGGYRLNSANSLLGAWDRSIPGNLKHRWRSAEVVSAYQSAALASDPTSGMRTPPSFRSPSGAMEDSYYLSTGRQLWDAAPIRAAVLIVRSGNDFWSRAADMDQLRRHLTNAWAVRCVTIPNATHFVHLDRPEHGRTTFLKEIFDLLAMRVDAAPPRRAAPASQCSDRQ